MKKTKTNVINEYRNKLISGYTRAPSLLSLRLEKDVFQPVKDGDVHNVAVYELQLMVGTNRMTLLCDAIVKTIMKMTGVSNGKTEDKGELGKGSRGPGDRSRGRHDDKDDKEVDRQDCPADQGPDDVGPGPS